MVEVTQALPNGWVEATLGDIGKVSMCKRILKKQTFATDGIPLNRPDFSRHLIAL